MSLEVTLEQTNELLKQIITMLATGVSAPSELGKPEVTPIAAISAVSASVSGADAPKRGRPRKEAHAEAHAEAPAPETAYWVIEKHLTVYAQEPGMTTPTIQSAEKVSREVYEAKKSEFAALVNAPSPAPTAHTEPTAQVGDTSTQAVAPEPKPAQESSTTPNVAVPSAPLTYDDVFAALTKVNKSTHGRDGVKAVLARVLPTVSNPSVSSIAARPEVFAAIVSEAHALLNPPADDYDPLA